jgi:hypothetical protein
MYKTWCINCSKLPKYRLAGSSKPKIFEESSEEEEDEETPEERGKMQCGKIYVFYIKNIMYSYVIWYY